VIRIFTSGHGRKGSLEEGSWDPVKLYIENSGFLLYKTIGSDIEDREDEEDDEKDELIGQTRKFEIARHTLRWEAKQEDLETLKFRAYCVPSDLQSLEEFLDTSPDPIKLINGKGEQGNSGLALAFMQGRRDTVALLYKRGANIESINGQGRAPLIEAFSYGLSSKNKSGYINRRRRLECSKWQRFKLALTKDFKKFQKRSRTPSECCKGAEVAGHSAGERGGLVLLKSSESQPSVLNR
jgi:hypothetical protein